MMIKAFAAMEKGGPLEPIDYDPGALGPGEVEIAVEHCGICHSDLSMLDDEWGLTTYPFVPGHEVGGRVAALGEGVTHLERGDRVGLGWHAGYCMTCPQCLGGDHNLCAGATATIVGRHGGFAERVRAQAASVVKLPEGVETSQAGPLFCGGITVFNPLVQHGLSPTAKVGVVGIGGLGHMALQFLRAWGCRVTAFTSTEGKRRQALEMGAHETLDSRDPEALEKVAGRFDLILSTVNVNLDWNGYLNTLKAGGRLHLLGAVLEPLGLSLMPMLMGGRSVSASPVGSPVTIMQMLDFAARHRIAPVTEHFPLGEVNAALDHLRAGRARYRVVLDVA